MNVCHWLVLTHMEIFVKQNSSWLDVSFNQNMIIKFVLIFPEPISSDWRTSTNLISCPHRHCGSSCKPLEGSKKKLWITLTHPHLLSWYCELVAYIHIQQLQSNIIIHLELFLATWWVQYSLPFRSVFGLHQLLREILGSLAAKCYTMLTS